MIIAIYVCPFYQSTLFYLNSRTPHTQPVSPTHHADGAATGTVLNITLSVLPSAPFNHPSSSVYWREPITTPSPVVPCSTFHWCPSQSEHSPFLPLPPPITHNYRRHWHQSTILSPPPRCANANQRCPYHPPSHPNPSLLPTPSIPFTSPIYCTPPYHPILLPFPIWFLNRF